MKKMKQFFVAVVAATVLTSAHSGSSSGKVSGIFMHSPDIVMFAAGAINNIAQCASGTQQWAIKLSDPAGKGFLAILLSAQAQGKSVYVQGNSNSCRDWGDRELPTYIMIID